MFHVSADGNISNEENETVEGSLSNIHVGESEGHQAVDHYPCSSDSDATSSDPEEGSTSSRSRDSQTSSANHSDNEAAQSVDSDMIQTSSEASLDRSSAESVNYLYENSDITVDEAILRVLKVYVKNRWTKTSLDSTVKLMRGLLPKHNNMPTSGDMLLKRLHEVAPFQEEKEHYYCSECHCPVTSLADSCKDCTESETEIFFEYPIDPQITYLFEYRNLASVIDQHRNRVKKDRCISDIQDGSAYIEIKSKLNGKYDIILVLNSDGVSLSKSGKQEVWSILCTISEIPPSLRSSFMILCGVFVSKKKPKMNTFLKPFVDSMKRIHDDGGVKWSHPQTKEFHTSQVLCPMLSADAPAKAYMLHVKPFSHRFGCNVCEQKSKKVPLTPAEIELNRLLPARKRKKPVRRFLFEAEPARLRDGDRMNLQGRLAQVRMKSRKGVVGDTALCILPFFNRALCICAEYLHVICLGAVKYFSHLMFCVRGPWYIGDKVEEIDEFLVSIQVPDFIKRLPRGMSDLKFFIGSEVRAYLLYYSLPALQGHLPPQYLEHWMLLVGAIFILLQEYISEDDLKTADLMLRLFVRDVGLLYGDKYYTYNIHNLLHLALLVERWGNLFGTSAFDFEKFNGFIVKHVHGTKHIGKELLNNVKIIQSVHVFETMVNASKLLVAHNLPEFELCGKPLSMANLTDVEHQAITEANIRVFQLFSSMKVKSEVLTSKYYDEDKKRSNSYVQFITESDPGKNYEYGQILHFVEDCCNRSVVHCLVDIFEVVHTKLFFHLHTRKKISHLLPVTSSNKVALVPLHSIMTKVMKAGIYLCLRPNSYEVNL